MEISTDAHMGEMKLLIEGDLGMHEADVSSCSSEEYTGASTRAGGSCARMRGASASMRMLSIDVNSPGCTLRAPVSRIVSANALAKSLSKSLGGGSARVRRQPAGGWGSCRESG
jgi:translation initiation factor 2 gamma subunit (eIF-2gamma)